jgi:hypothetical protein
MSQLTPITLDDGTIIYIEAADRPELTDLEAVSGEIQRTAKGASTNRLNQNFETIKGTITSYTRYTLNAFRELGSANVDKVTLEFGLMVAGRAGVPYITEGTAECNLKITVECSFPKKQE